MSEPFNYQTTFILDKSHFNECYEESVPDKSFKDLYAKGGVLLLIGAILVMFTELNPYASWFIFSLGVLELVSSYYHKPWWVARQMLSKVAKAEINLNITQESIHISSFYNDSDMKFSDIDSLMPTSNGWLISYKGHRHYISNRCLDEQALQFLQLKVT